MLGLLLAIRVVLPWGVARLIERQAGSALRARVSVGDVDLALWRGFVALEDFRLWEAGDPPEATPVVAWARMAVNLAWWPLVHKEVRIEVLDIDTPQVAIDRLATGNLNLVALLPEEPPPAPADGPPGSQPPAATAPPGTPGEPASGPATESTPGWGVAVDELVLRTGGIRFRDLMVPEAEPIEIALPEIRVAEVALRPGAYEQPGKMRLRLRIDRGRLDADATLTMRADGPVVDAAVRAVRLPLRRTRVYVPNVGMAGLTGEAGAALHLHYAPDAGPAVGGTVLARDVVVSGEALEEPALAWRQLAVRVDRVGLNDHQARVREVVLDAPALLVRPKDPDPVPLVAILRRRKQLAAAAAAQSGGPPPPAEVQTAEPTAGGPARVPPSTAAGTPAPAPDAPAAGTPEPAPEAPGPPPSAPPPAAAAPAPDATATATAPPPPQGATPEPVPGPPWRWTVHLVRVDALRVILVAEAQRLEVTGGVEMRQLAGPESAPAPLTVHLGVQDGTLAIDGTLGLAPVGFAGTVEVGSLALAPLVAISGAVPAETLTGGTLGTQLRVDAAPDATGVHVQGDVTLDGLAAAWPTAADTTVSCARASVTGADVSLPPTGAAVPIRVSGGVTLETLAVAQPRPGPLHLTLSRLVLQANEVSVPPSEAGEPLHVRADVTLDELSLLGAEPKDSAVGAKQIVVTGADVSIPAAGAAPPKVSLASIRLEAPSVQVTRTPEGLLVPGTAAPAAPEPAPGEAQARAPAAGAAATDTQAVAAAPAAGGATASAQAGAAPASPAAPADGAGPPGPEVAIGSLRLTAGRIAVTDRTVKPFYSGVLQPVTLEIDRFALPGPTFARLRLNATSKAGGRLQLTGKLGAQDGAFELNVTDLALAPFNPYATAASSYSIPRGTLTLRTEASRKGDAYSATSKIILGKLEVGGAAGDSLFQQQFGIPLTVALALLRDLDGDIVLNVPLESDAAGTRVGVGSVVTSALRSALLGALTSPLKMAGALFGGDDASAAPAALPFRAGRPDLGAGAEDQLDQLGSLLSSRPGLAVRLGAAPAPADLRWIAEQDVAADLGKPRGVLGTIGGIAERGTRNRVAAALAARAKDEEGPLSPEDAEALDRWIAERPAPSAERLAALAAARVVRVQEVLSQRHGIPASRVVQGDAPAEPPAEPSLAVSLGAAGS